MAEQGFRFGDPSSKGGDVTYARFWTKPIEDPEQTKIAGRPIYRDCDYVTIRLRDDPFFSSSVPVEPEHKLRYPKDWAAYDKTRQQAGEGIPLERAPFLGPAAVLNLKMADVLTVEQLAAMKPAEAGALGPSGPELCEIAKQYIQGDSKTVKDLRAKLAEQKREIDNLTAKLEQAQAMLDAAHKATAKAA